ncbi:MAG: MoaD/ThiS family protein [archaeon]|nr:MoaD/ThiS family protein [archaeon]
MKVKVKFLSGLYLITNEKEAEFEFRDESISIHDLIIAFLEKYGKKFRKVIFRNIPEEHIELFKKMKMELEIEELNFVVNSNIIHYSKDKEIIDGDTVVAFLPVAGG